MNFLEFYINEMLVFGKPQDKKYVVAFDKWIRILDDGNGDEKIFLEI
jgi:hypothetical protein